jgi:hypothetical protein
MSQKIVLFITAAGRTSDAASYVGFFDISLRSREVASSDFGLEDITFIPI